MLETSIVDPCEPLEAIKKLCFEWIFWSIGKRDPLKIANVDLLKTTREPKERRKMEKKVENLKVTDTPLPELMEQMENGLIQIPMFQRDFVWNEDKIEALFDSIYSSIPVGQITLWKVPKARRDFFRSTEALGQPSIEELPFGGVLYYVLDGQQRLMTLYCTLMEKSYQGIDFGNVCFDLNKEKFKLSGNREEGLVKVSNVWDDKKRDNLFDKYPEKKELIRNLRDQLHDYKIGMAKVATNSLPLVVEIFVRINRKKVEVRTPALVNARCWNVEFNLNKKMDKDLYEELKGGGFGKVREAIVIRALAFALTGSYRKKDQEEMDPKHIKNEWSNFKDAFVHAVNYLQNALGVKRFEFLPYKPNLYLLVYYFYKTGNKTVLGEHKETINNWFWRAAISQRYVKSTLSRTIQDRKQIFDPLINNEIPEVKYPIRVTREEFKNKLKETSIKRSTSALRNVFLCLLARMGPKHFENNSEIDLTKNYYADFKLNKHHIFPNKFLIQKDFNSEKRRTVLDTALIPEGLNKQIQNSAPSEYLNDFKEKNDKFDECMDSHLIPHRKGSPIWDDEYEKFLDQRAELIIDNFEDMAKVEFPRALGKGVKEELEVMETGEEKTIKKTAEGIEVIKED